jgi:hypothetical protein
MTIARKTRSRRKSKRVRRIRGTRRDRRIRGSRKVRTHYIGGEGWFDKLDFNNIREKFTEAKAKLGNKASEASKYLGLSNTPTQSIPSAPPI